MEKGKPGQRYLSVGETLTVAEMGRLLREAAGTPWRPKLPGWMLNMAIYGTYVLPQWMNMFTAVARYPLHSFKYDTSKARDELGMEFRSVKESLLAAAKWYGEHGYCKLSKR